MSHGVVPDMDKFPHETSLDMKNRLPRGVVPVPDVGFSERGDVPLAVAGALQAVKSKVVRFSLF